MSRVSGPGSRSRTTAHLVYRLLKWATVTVPLGLIGYMQGPAAFEDIHNRACGWPGYPQAVAGWFRHCPDPAAAPAAALPTRPARFDNAVDLPTSYPKEYWRAASPEAIRWMDGDWCFQTINFRARMAVRNGLVERVVASSADRSAELSFVGKGITRYRAFISNHGVFRLRDVDGKASGIFFQRTDARPRALQEFSRSILDDGSVRTDKKLLVLDCNRCTVTREGALDTYSCR